MLRDLETGVQRVHGLVEQFATASHNPDQFLIPLGRAFSRLKLQFTGSGLDALAQLCSSMETTARRGLPFHTKSRILRDAVGSMRFQLELEIRTLLAEDAAIAQAKLDAQTND